jgi:flagellar biosynthesis protein FlhA
LLSSDGELKVVTLDGAIEEECTRVGNLPATQVPSSALQISVARRVLDSLQTSFGKEISTAPPVLLCASPGRFYLRRLLEPFLPKVVVLSPAEIPPVTPVRTLGVVR